MQPDKNQTILAYVFWTGTVVFAVGIVVYWFQPFAGSTLLAVGSFTAWAALQCAEDLERQHHGQ